MLNEFLYIILFHYKFDEYTETIENIALQRYNQMIFR